MTTTIVEPVFVDTNILVYANVAAAPENLLAQTRLQELVRDGTEVWISRQILREYMARLSRPQSFTNPVPPAAITADVLRFQAENEVAEDGPSVTDQLLMLINSVSVGGKQIHDANIVASMLAHGLRRLLTHNVKDFQRYSPWINILSLV